MFILSCYLTHRRLLHQLTKYLFSDFFNSIHYMNQLTSKIRRRNNTQAFPCGRRKLDRTQTNNHISSNIYHSCNKCGKSYTTIYNLKRHLRFECGVPPQFECECGTRFKHKHHLTDHIRSCCTKLYSKN